MQREAFVRDFGYILTNRGDIDCESLIAASPILSKYRDNIKILNYESEVSSTRAREDIKRCGKSELVSEDVMKYIRENKLFL